MGPVRLVPRRGGRVVRRARPPAGWEEALAAHLSYLERHRGTDAAQRRGVRGILSGFIVFAREHGIETPAGCCLQTVDDWTAQIAARDLARATLAGYLTALRSFLRFLHAEECLARDLSPYVEKPRLYREATVPEAFTWAQMERLVQNVRPSGGARYLRDRAVVLLLMTTGLRSSEVAALTLEDVDCDRSTVTVRTRKSNEPLLLPLLPVVVEALRAWLQQRPSGTSFSEFFLTRTGRPFRGGRAISHRVRRLAAAAGLGKGRSAHAMRRGLGTHLLERGAGAGEIALILGHQSLRSTRDYLRASMALLREVADNYAELL